MPPKRFGRYEVQAEIGDGAMGRVYRARDPVVGRTVAIKTVKTELLSRKEAPEHLKRFRREAQAAGALSHPHIVSIFDIGDGYIVMEHLEGWTLQEILKDKGRIPPEEALRILAPVADAIDHAHRAGVVHRDIKPSNVMVLADGRPKLMDFGVAHLESSVMTSTGQILGSPSYMAPEQVAGEEVTSRADVYALAVVAYEMVTGQRPFQGSNITTIIFKIMGEPAPSPCSLNAALPSRYDDVFRQALAKDPAKRFPTAAAFVAALDLKEFEEALSAAMGPAPTAVLPATPASPGRKGLALAIAGALTFAALLAGLWLMRPVTVPPATTVPAETSASVAPPLVPPPSVPPPSVAPPAPRAEAPPRRRTPAPTRTPLAEGTLVEMGPGIVPPRRLRGETPSYPAEARRRRQEGSVTVSMIVTETGAPVDIRVVNSAGALLDEAALQAVRTWRFEPARKDGVKVRVRWVATQRFVLER
jgi:eukaryotic-like serine/threonine-protein kinase